MEENQLIEEPKLTFFQKIEKLFVKTGKISEYFFMIIIGITIVYSVMYLFTGGSSEFKKSMKKVNQIELKIDSVRENDKFYFQRLYEIERNLITLDEKLNGLDSKIDDNNQAIKNLKKAYNEKIKSVNNYSINELDSFFTKRYSKYYK